MTIRLAVPEDLDEIMRVVDTARQFMRAHGNMNQWINGYPSRELYAEDMKGDHCFVAEEDGIIHGVFSMFTGDDPTYRMIEDGSWLDNDPYVAIHRIGSDGAVKGILRSAVGFAAKVCPELRADTHADNHVMQSALERCGFIRCGIIHIEDGSPRVAFERPAGGKTE